MICQHLIDSREDICEICFNLDFDALERSYIKVKKNLKTQNHP